MAFYNQNEDEELQNEDPGAPVQTSQQSSVVGGGSAGADARSGAQNAQGLNSAQGDRSSNFVGLQDYLKANKTQASKLGDQTANVINQSAQGARSAVDDLSNTFNQKAGSAVQNDQNALSKVGQAETLSDPEKQALKNQYNAQYTGPNSLQDLNDQYTQASQKLNTAKQNVQSADTEEGRKNLIGQVNNKARTQGQTNFDNILLSAGGGREKVNQAAQANQDVTQDVLGQQNAAAQQKAADIKAQTDATRTATQSAVQNAQNQLQQQFDANDPNSKLYKSIQDTLNRNNQVAQDLGDQGALDQATMEALGLNEGQRLYNIDLNKYFSQQDPNAITKESVANNEDLARSQALAELMGGTSYLGDQGIGSYNPNATLNKDSFMSDLASLEQTLNPQLAERNKAITDAQGALDAFKNNPMNAGSYMGNFNIDSYNNPILQKQYQALKDAIAQQQGALSKWQSDVGYNRTARKA